MSSVPHPTASPQPYVPPSAPPGPPQLPFPQLIEVEASYHRSRKTPFHSWLAIRLTKLADQARFLQARDPDSFDAHEAVWEDWLKEGGLPR